VALILQVQYPFASITLEILRLIRRYLGDNRQVFHPDICVGTYFNRLLLSDQSRANSNLVLRRFDPGTSQSAGLLIQLSQVHLWIDGRYNMGLYNMAKGKGNLKTDLLSVRAGISFLFP
jgi:hypothetical protein